LPSSRTNNGVHLRGPPIYRTFYTVGVPLISELRAVLEHRHELTEALQRKQGRIIPWIFHRRGEPIRQIQKDWNKATDAAGLKGGIPHDLRRTAVRNLERAGVPRSAAMKLVGHKTESIYRRYAITDEAMLQQAGAKLSAFHRSLVKVGQSQTPRKLPISPRKHPQMRGLGWRRRPDLNRRVEVLQTSALTTWLRRPGLINIEERRCRIKT
jgi:hypothetical protein